MSRQKGATDWAQLVGMASGIGVGDASHKAFSSFYKQRYFLLAKLAQSKI